MFHVIAFKVCN